MHSPVTMQLTQRGQPPRRTILTSPALQWEMAQGALHQAVQQLLSLPKARRRCWGRRPLPALVSSVRVPARGARTGCGTWLGAVGLSHGPLMLTETWPGSESGAALQQEEVCSFLEEAPRTLTPELGEAPESHVLTQPALHLHRTILCDDVTTRSVARRKPALHRPQDSSLFPVSNPRFFLAATVVLIPATPCVIPHASLQSYVQSFP